MRRARATALALALAAALSACGGPRGRTTREAESEKPADTAAVPASADDTQKGPEPTPISRASVTLYFPSAAANALRTETREIVETKQPADRGAQIVSALLDGPKAEGSLPAVPEGTMLRRLWVERDGDAYADFSEELAGSIEGGSADEILTVFAIVDSLTTNVPEIRRVGILVAGRERDTFGHLDLRRPLLPDLSLAHEKPTE